MYRERGKRELGHSVLIDNLMKAMVTSLYWRVAPIHPTAMTAPERNVSLGEQER